MMDESGLETNRDIRDYNHDRNIELISALGQVLLQVPFQSISANTHP